MFEKPDDETVKNPVENPRILSTKTRITDTSDPYLYIEL